jgi:hypothetical protein
MYLPFIAIFLIFFKVQVVDVAKFLKPRVKGNAGGIAYGLSVNVSIGMKQKPYPIYVPTTLHNNCLQH